ncbi:MAG: serine hydrolase [Acidobacteria bacterium]|nr:serine hydrolase [Acidobacteriota bacterium]
MRSTLALLGLCSLLAAQPTPADVATKADAYVQSFVRDGLFRGTVLVARDGQPIFRKAYGNANDEWDIANTVDTKFRIGSITKQFTAVAILQFVEQGKLKLDDPISKHYAAPATWEKITIHHLLNHTSGIPSYTGLPGFMAKRSVEKMTPVEIVKLSQDMPLEFEPGASYKYNNTGYVLLGHLVEKISGTSYGAYMAATFFGPLGLKDTGYDSSTKILKHRASGYSPNGDNAAYLDMSLPHAAGSLYSTVDDLLKWDLALHGGKLLSAESYKLMTTPGKGEYGYGLVMREVAGRPSIAHGGGINGFNTNLIHFPAQRVVGIALANVNTPAADQIALAIARIAMGDEQAPRPLRKEVKVAPERLDLLSGEYELRPGFIMKIWRDGERMLTQATGQGAIEIFALSENQFFPKVVDAQLNFERDASGRATAMTLRQGSAELRGVRK